jgi:hypothetical protein
MCLSAFPTANLAQVPTPGFDLTDANIAGAAEESRSIIGAAGVSTDHDLCHSRASTPWVPTPNGQRLALVMQPASTDQTNQVAKTS